MGHTIDETVLGGESMPETLKDGPLRYQTGLQCQPDFLQKIDNQKYLNEQVTETRLVAEHVNEGGVFFVVGTRLGSELRDSAE